MTVDFILPELGENIASGDVVNVLVDVGDTITINQPVLEIETDKAVVEVPSTIGGVVQEILVQAGDTAQPGQVILKIEKTEGDQPTPTKQDKKQTDQAKDEAKPSATKSPEEPPTEKASPETVSDEAQEVTFNLPELGENIESGTVISILVAVGDKVEVNQPLLEVETDKAVAEVPSTVAGEIKAILVEEGAAARAGQALFIILATTSSTKSTKSTKQTKKETKQPASPKQPTPQPKTQPNKETTTETVSMPTLAAPPGVAEFEPSVPVHKVPAAPSVRRFAREIGVDITKVKGSGPGGRLSIQDVKNFNRHQNLVISRVQPQIAITQGVAPQVVAATRPTKPLPDFSKWGEVERETMSNIRRATAENLSYAWDVVPAVTQFDKADITELEKLRKTFNPKAEAAGGKLTITAILLKVLAAGLKAFPQFNASVDMENKEVIYKKYFHIGVAADTDRGLLVPVVRDVEQKNLIELSVELTQLAEKARTRKLKLDEMQGACFTISNLGGIGGTAFTPLINTPEVAILGVSRGKMEPVFNKATGGFDPRLMLPLSLSYDHRLIDGADGARFIRWLVQALENPFLLLVEG